MTPPETPTTTNLRLDSGAADQTADDPHARLQFQILESIQTVLTALMLAFMLRAFFIEAFIIPTGSMAEGLLGQHGVQVCPRCGWQFDFGPSVERGIVPGPDGFVPPSATFCPNCHIRLPVDRDRLAVRAGDRILVHKWPFVLGGPLGPRRWDVIVFRDPADPEQNFIKRLVGLPNETIEIIDGDVFIRSPGGRDFRVARKTLAAQSRLWSVVFDQNFLPADSSTPQHPPAWIEERRPDVGGWSGMHTRVIRHDSGDGQPHVLRFEPDGSRYYLQDVCAYNHGSGGNYVGDARLIMELQPTGDTGWIELTLIRDGYRFTTRLNMCGEHSLHMRKPKGGTDEILHTTRDSPLAVGQAHRIEFGHLDYQAYLRLDGVKILSSHDHEYQPNLGVLRQSRRINPLELSLTASGISCEIRNLRVDRDVYYAFNRTNTLRAYAEKSFTLGSDEYFVLGDNSSNSHDSREWYLIGPHLATDFRAGRYQIGTVPAKHIVGRAFFVYLPGLQPLDEQGRWRIPDVGRARFIR